MFYLNLMIFIKGVNMKDVIKFLRQKDYEYIDEIDSGGFGKAVLIEDTDIGMQFVCKKYQPIFDEFKVEYYKNFVNEIKFLHRVYHKNIVRVYNQYLYPKNYTGYILMEYIKGKNIEDHLVSKPEQVNEVFIQTIEAFKYLEENRILHRDIRVKNILVTDDGIVKVIDFGFGKNLVNTMDKEKSIQLNWWCSLPSEFDDNVYDFCSEIYFIGQLFKMIISNNMISDFKYKEILNQMCEYKYADRLKSFKEIHGKMNLNTFEGPIFSEREIELYKEFVEQLIACIYSIDSNSKYYGSNEEIVAKLAELSRNTMLEQYLYATSRLGDCFINGDFSTTNKKTVPTNIVNEFYSMITGLTQSKQNIVISNLLTRLDAIRRVNEDIPF